MMTLSLVDHPNLVKLVGYCVEAGQKLLVYEHMSLGSLEGHLHGSLFSINLVFLVLSFIIKN